MITYGLIALAVGIIIVFVGFGLHLANMKTMLSNKIDDISPGRVILPFALVLPGGFITLVGGLAAVVGAVLHFI